jgi:hypothetical protein
MQGQAPNCPRCGAIVTNPGSTCCVYCQSPLAVAPPPQAAGYGPPGYYPQQQGYGPPPGAYPGYGQGYPPVQQFGGYRQPYYGGGGSSWGNFWSVMWIIRIGIAVLVLGGILMAACINAISN